MSRKIHDLLIVLRKIIFWNVISDKAPSQTIPYLYVKAKYTVDFWKCSKIVLFYLYVAIYTKIICEKFISKGEILTNPAGRNE